MKLELIYLPYYEAVFFMKSDKTFYNFAGSILDFCCIWTEKNIDVSHMVKIINVFSWLRTENSPTRTLISAIGNMEFLDLKSCNSSRTTLRKIINRFPNKDKLRKRGEELQNIGIIALEGHNFERALKWYAINCTLVILKLRISNGIYSRTKPLHL